MEQNEKELIIKEVIKGLKANYYLFKKSDWYKFAGGLIGAFIIAGFFSWQAIKVQIGKASEKIVKNTNQSDTFLSQIIEQSLEAKKHSAEIKKILSDTGLTGLTATITEMIKPRFSVINQKPSDKDIFEGKFTTYKKNSQVILFVAGSAHSDNGGMIKIKISVDGIEQGISHIYDNKINGHMSLVSSYFKLTRLANVSNHTITITPLNITPLNNEKETISHINKEDFFSILVAEF